MRTRGKITSNQIYLLARSTVKQRQIDKNNLLFRMRKLLRLLNCRGAELSILLTNNQEMRHLNATYRGKNKSTDVLSFPTEAKRKKRKRNGLLGDIVISIPKAKKQAAALGHSLQEEILRLLIHGVLHLLGFEHEKVSSAERKRMQKLEEKIFILLSDQ